MSIALPLQPMRLARVAERIVIGEFIIELMGSNADVERLRKDPQGCSKRSA
jgi:hypothetical protein